MLVEDDADVSDALLDAIRGAGMTVECAHATNRKDALQSIRARDHFDLGICDLRIPSESQTLDSSTNFGRETFATFRERRPGTPVWVFSAYADEDDFLDNLLHAQQQGDPYGCGRNEPMVRHFRKGRLVNVVEELSRCYLELGRLNEIEFSTEGVNFDFSLEEERLLRIMTRRLGGKAAKLSALGGGLSGSRVLLLRVYDNLGFVAAQCVIKLGDRQSLEDEARRYRRFVPAALPPGSFVPLFDTVTDGAGGSIALAYTLAVEEPSSLGKALETDEATALDLLANLRIAESSWLAAGHVERMSIGDVCDLLSSIRDPVTAAGCLDGDISLLLPSKEIYVKLSAQHGDLHLENVIAGPSGPTMIDYGRTGIRVASYDPVSLELSLVFHPTGRSLSGDWPSMEQARQFDQLNSYLQGCPAPAFVKLCRQWAYSQAQDKEVYASFLAYALRQLKFPDTDSNLAKSYIVRAAEMICS